MSRNGQGSEVPFYHGHIAVSQIPRFTNRYGPETMSLPQFDLPALPMTELTGPSHDDVGWLSSLPDNTQPNTMPPLDRWDRPTSTLKWCPPLTGSAIESGTPLVENKRQGKALGSKAAMTRRPNNSKKPKGRKPGHSESYRGHYAVEQKYRSRLNEQFAALSQAIWRRETQRICRPETGPETGLPSPPSSVSQTSQDGRDSGPKRQNKIDVLSNAIDTIQLLMERCDQKHQELDRWGERMGSMGEMIRATVADLVDDEQSVDPSLPQMPIGSSATMMMHEPNGLEMRMLGLM